jgi:hypothetical protein
MKAKKPKTAVRTGKQPEPVRVVAESKSNVESGLKETVKVEQFDVVVFTPKQQKRS